MNKQHEKSEENVLDSTTDASLKKEWNAPDIKVIAPINRTAGGPGTLLPGDDVNYAS